MLVINVIQTAFPYFKPKRPNYVRTHGERLICLPHLNLFTQFTIIKALINYNLQHEHCYNVHLVCLSPLFNT